MATRVPNTRVMNFSVAGVPVGLDDDVIKRIVAESLSKEAEKIKAAKPRAKSARVIRLHNRTVRHKGTFPCERIPDTLHAAAILWPAGAPKAGCGRTFSTEKRRDKHMKGEGWSTKRFPNGCLDAILPMNLRETR